MIKRIFFLVPIFAVLLVFGSCASGGTIPDTTAAEQPTVSVTFFASPTTAAIPSAKTQVAVPMVWEYPTTGWNPLIAHGFGEWHGIQSPDNYEAFLESYAEGFRTFEVDIVMSLDGIPLAAHNRQESAYGLSGIFSDYTAEQFLAAKFHGDGTTMAGPQILQLLDDYPDIQIVLDVKIAGQASAIIWFLDRLPTPQWPRLLTNIRGEEQIKKIQEKYPSYHGIFFQVASWNQDLAFSDEDIRDKVTKYNLAGIFTWIGELGGC